MAAHPSGGAAAVSGQGSENSLLRVLSRLMALALIAGLLAASPARADPPDLSDIGYRQRQGAAVPLETRFTNQDGEAITLGEAVGGRPTLLALGYYTCPSLCGLVRDDLFAALAATGLRAPRDYRVVFISIDPAEHAADAARAFADDLRRYPTPGAEVGWQFLTGTPAAIAMVAQAVGYRSRFDTSLKQFIHPTGIVVLTPGGLVSSYVLGVGYGAGDLRAAVMRAGAGGIERAAQPILLLCFHYDPVTGRYSLAILKLLKLTGVLTVLTLVGLIGLLRWQERRV